MTTKLLLLHGALGTEKQFNALSSHLGNEIEPYVMNFEGHGGFESDEPFSIQLFTKNVVDFIQSKKLSGINVFGYSMGGYVALNLAIQHPELVGDIVTLGTKFEWTPTSAQKEMKMLIPEIIEEKVPKFADKLRLDHFPSDWKIVMNKTADMMRRMGNGQKIELEEFKQIKNSVTIGLGSHDTMVTHEESELIVRELPDGKLVVLENVPHPIDKGDPKVISSFIIESLKTI